MATLNELIITENKLPELAGLLEGCTTDRDRKKRTRELKQLEYDQETAVMEYLEANDAVYRKALNDNFDLLVNEDIDFVVTRESGDPFSSYAKELSGDIHDNGFLYFTTRRTNFVISSIQSGFYPLSYSGLINYLGESSVLVEKKGYKFLGSRVPQKYKGSIDNLGNVHLKTVESYWESGGSYYVNNVMADPFSGDEAKRRLFLENRTELKRKISEFRLQLTRSISS